MELKDQVKMIVDKSVTYFVAQDGNESGLVLTKQILYSLIELVEQQQSKMEVDSAFAKVVLSDRKLAWFQLEQMELLLKNADTLIESLKEEIEKLNEVIRTLGLSLNNATSTNIKEPIRCEHGFNVNLFCTQCIDQEGESHE